MRSRPFAVFAAAALSVATALLLVPNSSAQATSESKTAAKTATGTGAKKAWTAPRVAGGHPDLQGIWTNATITRMERLPEFNGKLNLSEAEAATFEKKDHQEGEEEPGKDGVVLGGVRFSGANAGYNALFIDRGSELARVDGQKRSSLIIDPADGKVPARVAGGGFGRGRGGARAPGGSANVKNHPISERCLLGFGSTSGPPMMPVLYNNNYQIVETPDTVMILVEMIHDVRRVRMNAEHLPSNIREWLGDSVGHWDGDTLVVDTTNFHDEAGFYGSDKNLHIIERFRRVDPGTLLYRVTIDDPTVWTKPWTMEYPFLATKGPVYEYACAEGNYALTDILGGAQKQAESSTKP